MNIKNLIRPHLLGITPYSSARDECKGTEGIFLDANENPFGSAVTESFNRYPDPLQLELKERISGIKGISVDHIFLGNGSDEPIDLIIRAFCEPGKESIIITPPTYGMYEVSANINHVGVKRVPLTENFNLDVDGILNSVDGDTKLIFLCSPNNPTGNAMKAVSIEKIITSSKGLVILDEAYIDFSREKSFIKRLSKFENLVVLQTFSKAWGLAALRLGMAFAHPEIVDILNKIKPPYNINGATQKLVLKALSNQNWKEEKVAEILQSKEKLIDQLEKLKIVLKVFPSDANFILVKVDNAKSVFDYLIDKRIIVRDRSRVTLCEGCLRITIGTQKENQQLIEALTNY